MGGRGLKYGPVDGILRT